VVSAALGTNAPPPRRRGLELKVMQMMEGEDMLCEEDMLCFMEEA
jgi:hypothetical protein